MQQNPLLHLVAFGMVLLSPVLHSVAGLYALFLKAHQGIFGTCLELLDISKLGVQIFYLQYIYSK